MSPRLYQNTTRQVWFFFLPKVHFEFMSTSLKLNWLWSIWIHHSLACAETGSTSRLISVIEPAQFAWSPILSKDHLRLQGYPRSEQILNCERNSLKMLNLVSNVCHRGSQLVKVADSFYSGVLKMRERLTMSYRYNFYINFAWNRHWCAVLFLISCKE